MRRHQISVDVCAMARNDVIEVVFVRKRERGEVEQGITVAGIGPVDDAGDCVAVDEDVLEMQVAVDERRCP